MNETIFGLSLLSNAVNLAKEKIALLKEKHFLKRHGCESWAQYRRNFDPNYDPRASIVKRMYYGYPYVYCFENHSHEVYDWDVCLNGIFRISTWLNETLKYCEKTTESPYRFDFLRVIKNYHGEWEVNEIGGADHIFVAFKNERDFLLFMLRWV